MSNRRLVPLLLLVAVVIGGGLWLTRDDRLDEPAPTVERPDEGEVADPILIGQADPTAPDPPDDAQSKPARPKRRWERVGFEVGDDADARATGRVVFEDGTPAGGALVWKSYVYLPFFRTAAERGVHDFHLAATKSDADGRYRFTHRQIHTDLRSAALLARHGELAALILEPEDDGTLAQVPDLVLRPAVVPRIDVVNAYGDPIRSTLGRLRVHFGGKGIPLMLLGDLGSGAGRLEFLPLPDREDLLLELEVKHAQYPDLETDLDVEALRRGEVLRIEMKTGREVRGRLLDSRGRLMKRFHLRVSAYDEEDRRQELLEGVRGQPGSDGDFVLRGVPARESRLLVYVAPKDVKWQHKIWEHAAQVIDVEAGRNGDVLDLGDLHLEAPGSITGTVTGPDGEPLAQAHVFADVLIEGVRIGRNVTTDASGTFVIPGLISAGYRVRAQQTSREFGTREVAADGVRPGSAPIALRLVGGSTLVVRLHPAGRPHESLRVKRYGLRKLERSESGEEWVAGGFWGGGGSGGRSVFRFKYEPGTYKAVFGADGYREVEFGPFEITEDADTAIDIELEPE